MDLKTAFKIYAHKGPVDLPGPQVNAKKAFLVIIPYLSEKEISNLQTAVSHALLGEGREEFDSLCIDIKQRLISLGQFTP